MKSINGARLPLRPHHVLCLRFFEGKGYSAAFVQNTQAVLLRLRRGARYTVVYGPDALCAACPNLENGVCRQQEKAARYDAAAAALLGLSEGETRFFGTLAREDARALLPEICADCEWAPVCGGKDAG